MTSARRLAAIAARSRTQPVIDDGEQATAGHELEEGAEGGSADLRLPAPLQACVVEQWLDLTTWRPQWPPGDALADWMLAAKVAARYAWTLERKAWAEHRDLDPRDLPPAGVPRFADVATAGKLLTRALSGDDTPPRPRRRPKPARA